MRNLRLARSYAQAIFKVGKANNKTDLIYKELKILKESFSDKSVSGFFQDPTLKLQDKSKAVIALINKFDFSVETNNFLKVLAEKGRTSILGDIVESFQTYIDEDNGVTRGEVISSHQLSPTEREQISDLVSKKTNKRVILTYKEDSKLIGGLIARVEGYTFDDTLSMHLNRLNEDLKRRVH